MTKKKTKKSELDVRSLRSINLELDLPKPSRLLGYVPTRKAVSLTSQILSSLLSESTDRAFAISAPYGSGKSSAALFWCQLLEMGKKPAELKCLFDEFKKKERDAEDSEGILGKWERRKPTGLAVPLVGFGGGSISGLVLSSIAEALERNKQGSLLGKIKKLPKTIEGVRQALSFVTTESGKYDSVLIVWDEFGKVLEQASLQGDGKALLEIQTLAEIASRSSSEAPVVLCILMHQTFARYSAALPGYVRNEWAKIEGRFKQVNYIEDSKEIYELISQVVSRKYGAPEDKKSVFKTLAEKCLSIGLFSEFDLESLTELLWSSAPLSPVSLYLLPRVSARVAQNERTMFSFLWSNEGNALPQLTKQWVSPSDIFDFFEDLMRLDTSVGGAHRLWVEANSALKKVDSEIEEQLVKALACIKVGTSSGSLSGTVKILELAFGSLGGEPSKEIQAGIKVLEKKKVIFQRRLTGEYSVWQGSDVDIRSAVEDRKTKLLESLEFEKILTRDFAPPYRFPQRHNDIYCIRRYFDGRYAQASQVALANNVEISGDDPYLDGRIYYVVAETVDELRAAMKMAESSKDEKILFAIPQFPLHLRDGLAELEAYHQLLADPDFRKQDPIVEQELKQLADDSEQHLKILVAKLVSPSTEGPIYFWKGRGYRDINTMGGLKRLLSKVCDSNFPKTPRINNELINKTEPSPQIVNARKSILRGIIEGYGSEQLGLSGYGPDVSVFRAIFLSTGLYKHQRSGEWSFAAKLPESTDKGLHEIWKLGIEFWSKPSVSAKDLRTLIDTWQSSPFGMRRGIVPLLLAATFRLSGSQSQVFEEGIFVTDFKPETFERMVKAPHQFKIIVPELKRDFVSFLDGISGLFGEDRRRGATGDKVKNAAQAIMVWLKDLPQIARERGMLSKDVDDLLLTLMDARDPNLLLSDSLKKLWNTSSYSETLEKLRATKTAMESIEARYFKKAKDALSKAVRCSSSVNLNQGYSDWISTLPGIQVEETRERYMTDKRAAGLISRVEQGYSSEHLFVMSLAELFTEKPLKFWNSSSFSLFEVNLHQTIHRMEDLADDIDLEFWQKLSSKSKDYSAGTWIERRVRNQFERVVQRLGKEEARAFVEKVMDSLGGDA